MTPLTAPGPNSNYLDWAWAAEVHIRAAKLGHVLDGKDESKLSPTWIDDNTTVVSLLIQVIEESNYHYIRPLGMNARLAWHALKEAHEDNTSGGRMYWLQKLIMTRMESGADIVEHIRTMSQLSDRLNALVTVDKPLTSDEIHATCLLISLPADWIPPVSHLFQKPSITSAEVTVALEREATRRSTQGVGVPVSASQATTSSRCSFCRRQGHDLASCKSAAKVLKQAKGEPKSSDTQSAPNSFRNPSRRDDHRQSSDARVKTAVVVPIDSSDDDDSSSPRASTTRVLDQPPSEEQALVSRSQPQPWLADTGCSHTMSPHADDVVDAKPRHVSIRLADNSSISSTHQGSTRLPFGVNNQPPVLLVPTLDEPLLSISSVCDTGCEVLFTSTGMTIHRHSTLKSDIPPVANGFRRNNLYYLPREVRNCSASPFALKTHVMSLFDWHSRLGHIGLRPLRQVLRRNNISPNPMNVIEVQKCETCIQSKMHRLSFKTRSAYRATRPGELIHSDVGSFETVSREGYKYYSTFIDDHSKYVITYLMKSKAQTFNCFKLFLSVFELKHQHKIIQLRSDNGGEYMSNDFLSYLTSHGILHEPGPPHSPELNGVAERFNRVIGERVRCALLSAKTPKVFWADALRHVSFALNSIPCTTPGGFSSPNEILELPLVDIHHLHPFGCLTWYKVPEANRKKLDAKGRSAMLLSYLSDGNGYRLWDIANRTVVKSRDVIFDDGVFPYHLQPSPPQLEHTIQVDVPWTSTQSLTPTPPRPDARVDDEGFTVFPSDRRLTSSIHNPDRLHRRPTSLPSPSPAVTPELPPDPPAVPPEPAARPGPPPQPEPAPPDAVPPPPRRTTRARQAPDRLGRWAKAATDQYSVLDEPRTWKQVLRSPDKHRWLKAADEELSSLIGMETWKLVPRPARRKVIKSKWVFKIKRDANNCAIKLKARLVAMGYSQEKGIDYNEVFAPTTRLETLRLVLTLMASRKWKGRQVDFKAAFLNGRLDEVIYMEQPQGYEDAQHPDHVCELMRSLYGLKQSPRMWNKELHDALISLSLVQSQFDPTLYFKIKDGKLIGAISIHVDDLAIVGEDAFVDDVSLQLSQRFTVSADHDLHHFLSLRITRDIPGRLVFLSQTHYIDQLQETFKMKDCLPVKTPTDINFKDLRAKTQAEDPSPGPYPQLIGSLLWVAQCTRADVSFAVSRLSQFLRDPSAAHWKAALRVLQYLISTKHLRLRLGGNLECSGYSDADWAEDRQDRKSTSAYTYRLGLGPVSWKSKKQSTVSLSSTESEYKALSDSCKEGLWLRNLLSELHLRPRSSIPLHVDNEGAEALAKNPSHHVRTKHIDTRHHFIRDCVKRDLITIYHVPTGDMLADMLTKPLPRVLLERHQQAFGIV